MRSYQPASARRQQNSRPPPGRRSRSQEPIKIKLAPGSSNSGQAIDQSGNPRVRYAQDHGSIIRNGTARAAKSPKSNSPILSPNRWRGDNWIARVHRDTSGSPTNNRRNSFTGTSPQRGGHRGGHRGRRGLAYTDNTGSPVTSSRRDSLTPFGRNSEEERLPPPLGRNRTMSEVLAVYDTFLDDVVKRLHETGGRLRRDSAPSPDHMPPAETNNMVKIKKEREDDVGQSRGGPVDARSWDDLRARFGDLDHESQDPAADRSEPRVQVGYSNGLPHRTNSRDTEVIRENVAAEVFKTLFPHDTSASLTNADNHSNHNTSQVPPAALATKESMEIHWSDSEPEDCNIYAQRLASHGSFLAKCLDPPQSSFNLQTPSLTDSIFCSTSCQFPRTSAPLVSQEERKRSIEMNHYPPSAELPHSPMQISTSSDSPPCSPSKRAKGAPMWM